MHKKLFVYFCLKNVENSVKITLYLHLCYTILRSLTQMRCHSQLSAASAAAAAAVQPRVYIRNVT